MLVRVLARASHQCGPGSNPAWCPMVVEFVVSSRHTPVFFFLRVLRFSSAAKK